MKTEQEKINEINGSDLFFFKSYLSTDEKYKILKWYNELSDIEKEYVDALKSEATQELTFFNQ